MNSKDQSSTAETELIARLFSKDTTLWSSDRDVSDSIRQRLGWLDTISFAKGQAQRLLDFSDQIKNEGFDRAILLGMGGSSLAPEVFSRCFKDTPGAIDLTVLDTTFPDSIISATAHAADGHALFIVSSKSGTTTETKALSQHFWHWARNQYGDAAGDHFVAITDEGSSLHDLARKQNYRDIFLNPADIGGRYSALSLFGLVPAYLLRIDVTRLLDRAQQVFAKSVDAQLAARLGIFMGEAANQGRDKLTLTFSSKLLPLGAWIEQLVAESTGKDAKGIVPIVDEFVRPPAEYGNDRLFVDIGQKNDSHSIHRLGERHAHLEQLGHPVLSLQLDDIYDLGTEFARWQVATSVAASIMGVNPFDEPDVNATKVATAAILRRDVLDGAKDLNKTAPEDTQMLLNQFVTEVRPTDYIAVLAYLPYDRQYSEDLNQLRYKLARQCNVATCLAFGPRYLHSSGQLHKGGKKNGHFLVVTAAAIQDLSIPEENYGFQHLINAQARGDIEVLKQRGQKVLHLDLGQVDKATDSLRQLMALLPA